MNNPLLMQIIESFKKISHDISGVLLVIKTFRLDSLEQLSSLQVFKDQMNVFVAFIHFI